MPKRTAQEGVTAEMRTRGNLEIEVASGNYGSTTKYRGQVLTKEAKDVAPQWHRRMIMWGYGFH